MALGVGFSAHHFTHDFVKASYCVEAVRMRLVVQGELFFDGQRNLGLAFFLLFKGILAVHRVNSGGLVHFFRFFEKTIQHLVTESSLVNKPHVVKVLDVLPDVGSE